MQITEQEYAFRAKHLQSLPCHETSRLIGFIDWLETDERSAKILERLRAIDVEDLIKGGGPLQGPQPKSPEDVAAIGLCAVDSCKHQGKQLFEIARSLRVSTSTNHIQDYCDTILHSYVHPLIEYVANSLFLEFQATITDIPDGPINTKDVFVVHGRDDEAKETVARFIERLELMPIILHEQANKGRTIIEKFEDHAEVQFAVILLTPDEIGRLVTEPNDKLELQARQNVIFEMGFFIGRIGRERVLALKKGDVQVPSDYNGVVYTDMDQAGAWKWALVRELKEAGFDVDANKAI